MLSASRDYWWVYLMQGSVAWAQCKSGDANPQVSVGESPADIPVPPGARVLLCVPGEHVRIHRLQLPARNRRQFMAALPYALEEKLLRDPSEYHFVPLGRANASGNISIAVTEHSRMREWLEIAGANDWRVEALVPDYLMLREQGAHCWLLDVSDFPALLASADGGATLAYGSGSCELPGLLSLAMESVSTSPAKIRIRIANEAQGESLRAWQEQLESRQVQSEFFSDGRTRHSWLIEQGWPRAECNLLVGDYAPVHKLPVSGRSLLPTTVISLVLLALVVVYTILEYSNTLDRYTTLQLAMRQVYLEAFPGARNIVDPRYQMEQKITELESMQDADVAGLEFVSWLESFSSIVVAEPSYSIKSINYEDEKVVLDVNVPDYDSLERLRQKLSRHAKTSLEKGELQGEIVSGRLVVEVKQ